MSKLKCYPSKCYQIVKQNNINFQPKTKTDHFTIVQENKCAFNLREKTIRRQKGQMPTAP